MFFLFLKNEFKNISRSTIYREIKDCNDGKDWSYKKSSGRPRITSEKKNDRIGASTRTLSIKFHFSHMTGHHPLKEN